MNGGGGGEEGCDYEVASAAVRSNERRLASARSSYPTSRRWALVADRQTEEEGRGCQRLREKQEPIVGENGKYGDITWESASHHLNKDPEKRRYYIIYVQRVENSVPEGD